MTKNLVVCCDGTGNEIEEDQSNVLKLYRVLKKSAEQRVFYEPGIGTMGADNQWTRLKQGVEKIAGLALGYGLDRDVLNAYEFLVKNYMPGDAIFLFGFSRGAYTARVLAGFINTLGLLTPDQINLSGFAFVASFNTVYINSPSLHPAKINTSLLKYRLHRITWTSPRSDIEQRPAAIRQTEFVRSSCLAMRLSPPQTVS